MTDPTDLTLPFTEKPGVLFVAPLGSDLPDMTVKDGIFMMGWHASWVLVLGPYEQTDPAHCSTGSNIDTDAIRVADTLNPLEVNMAARRWWWSFGPDVPARLTRWLIPHTWSRASGIKMDEVRMMLGWECSDSRDRVIARQCVIRDGLFHLEQAHAPLPPQSHLRWWHRLMWWRKPTTPSPQLHPPFEIYTVGELRRV